MAKLPIALQGAPGPEEALPPHIPPAEATGPRGWLERLDRAAEWASGWLQSGPACAGFILLFCLFHFTMRSWIFPGGANDDAEQQLYAQSFALGYQYTNPPLFTWLLLLAQGIVGQGAAALQLVKGLLFGVFFLSYYLVARAVTVDRRYALAAVMAPFAIYFVAFDAMRTYSHSISLIAMSLATLAVFLRLKSRASLVNYLLFGLVLGLGLVSKYNFALFAAALLLTGLFDAEVKARLSDRRILASLAIALAIAAPNLVWLAEFAPQALERADGKLMTGGSGDPLGARLQGLFQLFHSLVEVLLPLPLLLPLCFPRSLLARQPDLVTGPEAARALSGQRLLGLMLLILLAIMVAAILVLGIDRIRNHYLLVFLAAPLWFFARASHIEVGSGGLHRFFALTVALGLAAAVAVAVKFVVDPSKPRGRPYTNVPYAALAEGLREVGFVEGTVFAFDDLYTVSGHLMHHLPESRFLSGMHHEYVPPLRDAPGQCLIVWFERDPGEAPSMPREQGLVALEIDPAADYREGFVERPFAIGWGNSFKLSYQLYEEPAQRCR